MKLGISYLVADGEELLEYAIRAARAEADFVSAVYQEIGFCGQQVRPEVLIKLEELRRIGILDEFVRFDNDLTQPRKINETAARNLGLDLSRAAGCTHHISADVDEFYQADQLRYAKGQVDGHDCSLANLVNYFKRPNWRLRPSVRHVVTFLHPVDVRYDQAAFPYPVDRSRRLARFERLRVFRPDEIVVHHLSHVRKDIRRKLACTSNRYPPGFAEAFATYRLGDRVCLPPNFLNQKTELADTDWGIPEEAYGGDIGDGTGPGGVE